MSLTFNVPQFLPAWFARLCHKHTLKIFQSECYAVSKKVLRFVDREWAIDNIDGGARVTANLGLLAVTAAVAVGFLTLMI